MGLARSRSRSDIVAEPNATRAGRQAGSVLACGVDARPSALDARERDTNVGSVSCEAVSGGAVEWRAGPSLERGALGITRGFDGGEPHRVLGPALERRPEDAVWLAPVESPSDAQRAAFERWAGAPLDGASGDRLTRD